MKKIMIVDDDPDQTLTVKEVLEQFPDYKVITINSGIDCINYLKNNEFPNLILMDIMMPKMTGWQTLEQIKEHPKWKKIPIIFLTARTDSVAKHAGNFLGDDYIEKPVSIDVLKERIEKVLKKY